MYPFALSNKVQAVLQILGPILERFSKFQQPVQAFPVFQLFCRLDLTYFQKPAALFTQIRCFGYLFWVRLERRRLLVKAEFSRVGGSMGPAAWIHIYQLPEPHTVFRCSFWIRILLLEDRNYRFYKFLA